MKLFAFVGLSFAALVATEPIRLENRDFVCADKRPSVCQALAAEATAAGEVLDRRADPTVCNSNNCARAVTGTREGKTPGVASRQADCSSYQLATAYTYANGVTATIVTPTAVPTYATPCSSPINAQTAYASACSCWGITTETTTISTAAPACTPGPNEGSGRPAPAYPCAGGYEGLCYCAADVDGTTFCDASYYGGDYIHNFRCAGDADCPSGYQCSKYWSICDRSYDSSFCLP